MTETPTQKALRAAHEAVRIAFQKAEDAINRAKIPFANSEFAKEAVAEADAATEAADAAYEAWEIARANDEAAA